MIVIKSIIKRVFLWPWRGICFYAILFLMAMMGFGLILFLTDGKGIIGLRYDTFNFFLIAKWFIDPGYFSKGDYWLLDEVRASLHRFPPFFSAILAGFTKIGGHDFLSTLRWVYASLLGVNIILVGLILKGSIKSFWLVFLGIVWIFVSIDMLDLHSLALSEALFVFLMLVWFKYLMDFINNSKTSSYFICFFIIGLACITRWAGLTLFITSMFSIHIFKKGSLTESVGKK